MKGSYNLRVGRGEVENSAVDDRLVIMRALAESLCTSFSLLEGRLDRLDMNLLNGNVRKGAVSGYRARRADDLTWRQHQVLLQRMDFSIDEFKATFRDIYQ